MWWWLFLACGGGEPERPPTPQRDPEVEAAALAQVEAAAKALGQRLKQTLINEMSEKGAVSALSLCSDQAQGLSALVRAETGVTVGRSSSRLRNPANEGPDWVRTWLNEQGERPAEGVGPTKAIVQGEHGLEARVLLPITVEPPCLACHGKGLGPEISDALAARYPQDRAVDYAVGDLRGVLWASAPVRVPE